MNNETDEDEIPLPEEGIDLKDILESVEIDFINKALKKAKGNRKKAAKLLGLNRTTLVEKIKKKGIKWAAEKSKD